MRRILFSFSIELIHVAGLRHKWHITKILKNRHRAAVSGYYNYVQVRWRGWELTLEW